MRLIGEHHVHPELMSIINRAQKHLILVSPYWDCWATLETAIRRAAERKAALTMVARGGRDRAAQQEKTERFSSCGRLFFVERLHAKIYLNEATALITSMNLVESSAVNSLEAGVVLDRLEDEAAYAKAFELCRSLVQQAELDAKPAKRQEHRAAATPRRSRRKAQGHCIRCNDPIPLNADEPFCADHYRTWARYGDENYEERYCHQCGDPGPTCKRKPLCYDCWTEA